MAPEENPIFESEDTAQTSENAIRRERWHILFWGLWGLAAVAYLLFLVLSPFVAPRFSSGGVGEKGTSAFSQRSSGDARDPVRVARLKREVSSLQAELRALRQRVKDLDRQSYGGLRPQSREAPSPGPYTASLPQSGVRDRKPARKPKRFRDALPKPAPKVLVRYVPLPAGAESGNLAPVMTGSLGEKDRAASPASTSQVSKTYFAVRLMFGKEVSSLRQEWARLLRKHNELFRGLAPRYRKASGSGSGRERQANPYVLLAGPFPDAAEAIRLCLKLKKLGIQCSQTEFSGKPL